MVGNNAIARHLFTAEFETDGKPGHGPRRCAAGLGETGCSLEIASASSVQTFMTAGGDGFARSILALHGARTPDAVVVAQTIPRALRLNAPPVWLEAEGARRSAATMGSITAAATASSSGCFDQLALAARVNTITSLEGGHPSPAHHQR